MWISQTFFSSSLFFFSSQNQLYEIRTQEILHLKWILSAVVLYPNNMFFARQSFQNHGNRANVSNKKPLQLQMKNTVSPGQSLWSVTLLTPARWRLFCCSHLCFRHDQLTLKIPNKCHRKSNNLNFLKENDFRCIFTVADCNRDRIRAICHCEMLNRWEWRKQSTRRQLWSHGKNN